MNKQLSLIFIALTFVASSVWGQQKSAVEKELEKIGLSKYLEVAQKAYDRMKSGK